MIYFFLWGGGGGVASESTFVWLILTQNFLPFLYYYITHNLHIREMPGQDLKQSQSLSYNNSLKIVHYSEHKWVCI